MERCRPERIAGRYRSDIDLSRMLAGKVFFLVNCKKFYYFGFYSMLKYCTYNPDSNVFKSMLDRNRPDRIAVGPMTVRYRFK